QHPVVRRLWPRRWRRSDVYWRLVALERRYGLARRLDRGRGRAAREEVVQDVEVSVAHLPELLAFLHQRTGIAPVWLCPIRRRDSSAGWDLYPLDPAETYVNAGFWSSVPLPQGR